MIDSWLSAGTRRAPIEAAKVDWAGQLAEGLTGFVLASVECRPQYSAAGKTYFAAGFVEGLANGAADENYDGLISLFELSAYLNLALLENPEAGAVWAWSNLPHPLYIASNARCATDLPVTTRELPELFLLPARDEEYLRSITADHGTWVTFHNSSRTSVLIFWLDYQGERKQYCELGPGLSHNQATYVTHPWVVCDPQGVVLALIQPSMDPSQVKIW